jgi:hypothetical protein
MSNQPVNWLRQGTEVYWTDPDNDASSGVYHVDELNGDEARLSNDAGSEVEVFTHELSATKPE